MSGRCRSNKGPRSVSLSRRSETYRSGSNTDGGLRVGRNFLREGDACTAYFFQKLKKRRAKVTITKLKTEDGVSLETHGEIGKEIHNFYRKLYAVPQTTEEGKRASRELIQNLNVSMSLEQRTLIDDEPTEREIFDIVKMLPSGKSPGPDGLGVEVLLLLWPVVSKLYCQAFQEFWDKGHLLPAFKEGFFSCYQKLMTPWRSTHNCIIHFALVHEALKMQRKSTMFLMLDQEKAYDRLLPEFLWDVMRGLEFSQETIRRVQALQTEVKTRIILNGTLLPTFDVGRGVRQGCPLSPLLFVLVTIPFIQGVQREIRLCKVKAVDLKPDLHVSIVCLADDVAIYMEPDERSMNNLFVFLRSVEIASGERINKQKSKLLIVGKTSPVPQWWRVSGFQVIQPEQPVTYLGGYDQKP
ncbi:hypothetical protein R1sor_022035 [Riccia sorocarpa]|uniref:Reverse transcriptase domain-containing protein n=1 Tax=Riccia sorocarpa TaxID=122646 RepID=A0ABD3GKW5_9MARC